MRGENPVITVDENKSIKLNGQNYGYINGFDLELNISNLKSLFSLTNVKKSIRSMIEEKIDIFLQAPSDSINLGDIRSFKINEPVNIYWGDEPVGKLVKGINIFSPKAEALNTDFLESDKKILITGANGYIGKCLYYFLKRKFKVIGIDKETKINNEIYRCNVLNTKKLDKILKKEKPKIIVHLAAQSLVDETINKKKYYKNNVIATNSLLKSMKKNGINKLVFSSTAAVYQQSSNPLKENLATASRTWILFCVFRLELSSFAVVRSPSLRSVLNSSVTFSCTLAAV